MKRSEAYKQLRPFSLQTPNGLMRRKKDSKKGEGQNAYEWRKAGYYICFDEAIKREEEHKATLYELREIIQDLIDDPYSELTLRRAEEALSI